jgi:nitric oxide reductase NorD protein
MELGPRGAATDIESEAGENLVRGDAASALHEDDAVSAPVDLRDLQDPVLRLGTLTTIQYPEWDARDGRLVPRAVTVRVVKPTDAEPEWATRTLREHAPLVRQIRHRFERLRARRTRLTAQRDGEDLDVSACVRAFVDRAAGAAGDDRLYVAVRPARRPIAILLLVDVSGSTDLPIAGTQRIIDVERTAVLLAGEALEAMGDAYAMLAFSGRGAQDVRIATIKDFSDRHGDAVRRRVSALEPRGNTRLGAAIRHASAMLSRQNAGHRLLLLLSDGQPNDADRYQGEYGIEDSRQAVHEARAKGVFPFCLTVDREGAEYLPRIFGAAGHTILRHPEQLPTALLDVVKALVVE